MADAIAMEGLTVNPGEMLFNEGEKSREIYVLLKGRVTLKKGVSVIEELDMAGSVFGEMAELRDIPREMSAMTNTLVTAMVIRDLSTAIQQMPSTGLQLAKALARQVVKANRMAVRAQEQLRRCKEEYQGVISKLEGLKEFTSMPRFAEIVQASKESAFAERERGNLMVYKPSADNLGDSQSRNSYSEGEIVFRENDTTKEVYILIGGKLGVRVGDKLVATIDGKGSFIGEMSILRNEPRSATIEVVEDAQLMVIEDLEDAIGKTPTIGIKLAQTLANRVYDTQESAGAQRNQLNECRSQYQELVDEITEIYRKFLRLPKLKDIIDEAHGSLFMQGGDRDRGDQFVS